MSQDFSRQAIFQQRVEELLGGCMDRHEIDLWLVYTRESSRDPMGRDVGLEQVVARSAGLFARPTRGTKGTKNAKKGGLIRRALVASYDTTPVEESGIYEEVIPFRQEGIAPLLAREIEALDPQRIALNWSSDVAQADGLSFGMHRHLVGALGADVAGRFVSAEPLLATFRARKLPREIDLLRRAVEITQAAAADALVPERIHPGETREIDLGEMLESAIKSSGAGVSFTQVTVGPCRGHADPTERRIKPGDLIRIDFGAELEGYHSDIQRTAYVLRAGEDGAPEAVRRLFDATLKANRAGIDALRPGARGRDIDRAARTVITEAGYDEYPHATGHAIGLAVHELGPILGPPWPGRYGSAVEHACEPGMVFAVEPAAYVNIPEVGGEVQVGLEEDVLVTSDGAEILGTPQSELILLPSGG